MAMEVGLMVTVSLAKLHGNQFGHVQLDEPLNTWLPLPNTDSMPLFAMTFMLFLHSALPVVPSDRRPRRWCCPQAR